MQLFITRDRDMAEIGMWYDEDWDGEAWQDENKYREAKDSR
jgi:hypothetical protein